MSSCSNLVFLFFFSVLSDSYGFSSSIFLFFPILAIGVFCLCTSTLPLSFFSWSCSLAACCCALWTCHFLFSYLCSSLYFSWLDFHYLTPYFGWFLFVACTLNWSCFQDSFQVGITIVALWNSLEPSFSHFFLTYYTFAERNIFFIRCLLWSPCFIFSPFFCSLCSCFSFEDSDIVGPFFIRVFRKNDVMVDCLTFLSSGRGALEIHLPHVLILPLLPQPSFLLAFVGPSSELWHLPPALHLVPPSFFYVW